MQPNLRLIRPSIQITQPPTPPLSWPPAASGTLSLVINQPDLQQRQRRALPDRNTASGTHQDSADEEDEREGEQDGREDEPHPAHVDIRHRGPGEALCGAGAVGERLLGAEEVRHAHGEGLHGDVLAAVGVVAELVDGVEDVGGGRCFAG